MGNCALITPVYLEIALFSGARSGTQTTGQVISAIETADISIRALREEGDRKGSGTAFADGAISIHALREEGDPGAAPADGRQNISIHALLEEGDGIVIAGGDAGAISIRALREEGDR